MKLLWWMSTGSILAAIVVNFVAGRQAMMDIWLGMAGPLIATIISWIAMVRQYAQNNRGMTRLLIRAFAAKVVFFAVYIIVLLRSRCVRPIPFVICFAGFYLALHILEAIGLSRMQTAGSPAVSDAS
jgi:F0F1-type ATP synthase assembly protein I